MDTAEHVNMTIAMLRLQAKQAPANDPKACSVSEDGANIIEAQAAEIERMEAELSAQTAFREDFAKLVTECSGIAPEEWDGTPNWWAFAKEADLKVGQLLNEWVERGKQIERLKAEKRAYGECYFEAEAQLAEMRAELTRLRNKQGVNGHGFLTPSDFDLIRQALATDGKAAADVLAAAVAWRERTGTLGSLIEKAEAYRNKGRDDG